MKKSKNLWTVNNMRLIDADELMELYSLGEELEECTKLLSVPIAVIRQNIKDIPTIDAVPVVRCSECKHQEDCFSQIGFWSRDHILEQNNYEYHKLDFCSYGERKKPPETEGEG